MTNRFDNTIGIRRDEVGAVLSDIEKRTRLLEEGAARVTSPGTDIPTVDTSFAPVYDRTDKRGVYVTLRFNIPGDTYELHIALIERALAVDEASYDSKRLKVDLANAIEDKHRSASPPTVTDRLDKRLKYATTYDIIRLIAVDAQGGRIANPQNTNFAPIAGEPLGYPGNVLFSFTTPERFGSPPFPTLSDIDTQLDPETDAYDAYAIITNICPLHPETGAAQSYRAAGVDWVQNVIQRDYGGTTGIVELSERNLLTESELDTVVVGGPNNGRGVYKVKFTKLIPGGNYALTKVMVHTVDGKRSTNGSVAFVAGSLSRSLAALTNVALVFSTQDPFDDGNWADVALEFTQPWPNPVSLRNITQDYKRSTQTDWKNLLTKDPRVQSDIYHRQVNAGTVNITNGSTTLNGAGTQMTRWEPGWKIKVGAQTFTIREKPTSDTTAQVTVAAVGGVIPSAYTVVMVVPLHRIKVKANRTYNNEVRLVARGNTSLVVTGNAVIGADGHLVNDTAPPVLPITPTLKDKPGKLILLANLDISAASNMQTVKDRYELAVHDSVNSLNIGDPSNEALVSGIVFYKAEGPRVPIPVDRDHLLRIFGPAASLRARFRVTNDFAPTTTSDSLPLPLTGLRDVTTLYNPNNLLRNGHFTYHDGTTAKRWEDYDPRSGVFGNVDQVGKLRADLNEHRAKWRDTTQENTRFLVQNLGQIFMRSEYYSLIWNMYSNGTPVLDEVVAGLYTQKTLTNSISGSGAVNACTGSGFITDGVKNGTVIGNGAEWRTVTNVTDTVLSLDRAWTAGFGPVSGFVLIPQATRLGPQFGLALSTVDKFQRGTILTDADLDTSRAIYFVVIVRDVIDTTTFTFIDAICLNAGQESAGFQRSVDSFETNDAGTNENFDSQPTGGSSSRGGQPPGAGSGDPGEVLPVLL